MNAGKTFTDQNGKEIPWQEFIAQVAESILANLIACHRAGIGPEEIRIIVGKDGGTILGGGAMFQTPLAKPMTEDEGRDLFAYFQALLKQYEAKELSPETIARISGKNNVEKKIEAIRKSRKD